MSCPRFLCALVCAWILASSPATAQTATSIIHGNVTDGNGAALVNVTVTATLAGTNSEYRAVTNADGNYVIPGLRPGQYSLSFDLPGFRKAERAGIRVEVSQQARVDMVLQVGEVRDVVTVNADASTVETSNATLKTVVDSRRMVDLPLNGRQALQLQALTPGAVQVNTGQAATLIALNTGLSFSINGARPNASSYYLDGGINMDMYNNLATAFPNPDALQEFSVQANNFSAVHGRNAGGVINMVTRAGTNDYHGTIYEFLRNDVLNTRNFFSLTKPTLRRNQYGGTVGGPLSLPKKVFGPLDYEGRDRTFFFFSFEGMRERNARTRSDIVVPTALERRGDFSQSPLTFPVADPNTVTAQNPRGTPFPGNIVPANRIDPVAKRFAEIFLPLPNLTGGRFGYNLSIPTDDDQFVVRIDHALSNNNKLNGRFFYDNFSRQQNEALLDFNSENRWRTKNFTLNDQHVFSPKLINTATLTFARNPFVRSPLPSKGAKNWAELGCVSCRQLAPDSEPTDWAVSINRGFGVRVSTAFQSYMTNWHVVDNLSLTQGNHLLSVGAEYGHFTRNGREYFQVSPNFNFDGLRSGSGWGFADFFLGVPRTIFQNSPLRSHPTRNTIAAYIQDDWKVSKRLTLNLGLRYEPFLPVLEKRDELGAFRPGQQSKIYPLAPTGMLFPGDDGIGRGIIPARLKQFAPRVGFALDPRGDGRTSIRAAYGIFYDTLRLVAINTNSINQPFSLGRTTNDPFSLTDPYRNSPETLQLLLSYAATAPAGRQTRTFFRPVRANSIDPDFTPAYVQQWNLSVQQQLPREFVVTVAYVGSKGTKLFVGQEINPAVFIPGQSTAGNIDARRIYQGFQTIQNTQATANSTYHSLQLSWNKRVASGFSLLGSYVFSKSLDLASNDGNSGVGNGASNPFNFRRDKGPSDFDVPHRFVTSFIWELPFFNAGGGVRRVLLGGWQLNGIVTLQTGTPFSVGAGQNRSLAGGTGDRADLIGVARSFNDKPRSQKIEEFFDTSVFALPALGTFGTSGRNILYGPGLANTDIAAQKYFRVTESKSLEFRWEVFNLFNRPNFTNPNTAFCPRTSSACNFGRILSARDPRIMQAGLKLRF